MKLIKDAKELAKLRVNNPGKTIGAYKVRNSKVTETAISMTDAHYSCIQKLRAAPCDIIILEFIDLRALYPVLDLAGPAVKKVKPKTVLDLCNAANIDADYLVYCHVELEADFNQADVDGIAAVVTAEDYQNELGLTERQLEILKVNLAFTASRYGDTDFICRSVKDGPEVVAFKHYVENYFPDIALLVAETIFFPGTKIPLSSSFDISEMSVEAKDFAVYFHSIPKADLVAKPKKAKEALVKYAEDLGYAVEDVHIQKGSKYVGADKVFASVVFKGLYNSSLTLTRSE